MSLLWMWKQPSSMMHIFKFVVSLTFPTFVAGLLLLRLIVKLKAGRCTSQRDMTGKTVIITGANSGIGKETARDLARRNARVILCCRNRDRGESAASEIRHSTGNSNVVFKLCDLSSLKSVRQCADDILKHEDRLDVLINNAGMNPLAGKRYLTDDGIELQFAANHLGHFLLTLLLLPLLRKSAPSRIVIVSSLLYTLGKIEMDNLQMERRLLEPIANYCNTKLANLLFMRELARRLHGTKVTVNALHPGIIATGITRNSPWYLYFLGQTVYRYNKTPTEGAQTSIYLAVAEEVEGKTGKFFTDCREKGLFARAQDDHMARKLWDVCISLAEVTEDELSRALPIEKATRKDLTRHEESKIG